MTTTEKGQIVGLGLYLELVPKNAEDKRTTQILFTPEGFDINGNYVQFAMLSRTISDWSPRKQWRINLSGIDNRAYFAIPSGTTPELPADVLTTMTTRFEKSLERYLSGQEVELRSKPIVLEITSIDLADVREYKAPTPALRRLQKARVSLGFPEKLF